jgi:hypothetical protein
MAVWTIILFSYCFMQLRLFLKKSNKLMKSKIRDLLEKYFKAENCCWCFFFCSYMYNRSWLFYMAVWTIVLFSYCFGLIVDLPCLSTFSTKMHNSQYRWKKKNINDFNLIKKINKKIQKPRSKVQSPSVKLQTHGEQKTHKSKIKIKSNLEIL